VVVEAAGVVEPPEVSGNAELAFDPAFVAGAPVPFVGDPPAAAVAAEFDGPGIVIPGMATLVIIWPLESNACKRS